MKALKYLAVAAVIILGFTACEKKDNNQSIGSDVITEQAYTDLFQRLDEYNSTFEFDTPVCRRKADVFGIGCNVLFLTMHQVHLSAVWC